MRPAFDRARVAFLRDIHRTAVACLPLQERTSLAQVKIAETILQEASTGEIDRIRLLSAALAKHRTEHVN
jgi:hypothetical protein